MKKLLVIITLLAVLVLPVLAQWPWVYPISPIIATPRGGIITVAKSGGDYTTIQEAIAVASGNVLINVAPGEYAGDFNLGVHVVGIRGSGINATIFTGNIIAGDRAHSLEEFRVKSTGSLTITDTILARNLHLQCAVTVSGAGFLNGTNIYIAPSSGVVPLTASSSGGAMLNEVSIVAQGAVNAINQNLGTIVLFHSYAVNNSIANPTINSTGGVIGVIDTSVANAGFGVAISMDNDGTALKANTLSGIVCSGNIVCGSATTYIEGLNFVAFGSLSGSALVYRAASRIDNDSVVAGATVKDALDTLAVRNFTVTIDNTDGVDTYLAAQILGGLIRRGVGDEITGAVIDITDTAANIVAAIPGCIVGSGFEFSINNEDSTNTIQVDGGVGVTIAPNDPSTAIPVNSTGRFLLVVTNATAASEAVTIYAIGFTTH